MGVELTDTQYFLTFAKQTLPNMDEQAQLAAVLQQLQSDPAAAQQLQVEMQKIQVDGLIKAQVSEIQKSCFKRCIETTASNRLTHGEEQCMLQCAMNQFSVADKVKRTVQEMLQQQQQQSGFHSH